MARWPSCAINPSCAKKSKIISSPRFSANHPLWCVTLMCPAFYGEVKWTTHGPTQKCLPKTASLIFSIENTPIETSLVSFADNIGRGYFSIQPEGVLEHSCCMICSQENLTGAVISQWHCIVSLEAGGWAYLLCSGSLVSASCFVIAT